MSFSYEPLWQMLNSLNISKMEFAKLIGMSNATLAKLSKNEPITLTTVDKICNQFNCSIESVVKHIQDPHTIETGYSKGTIVMINDFTDTRLRKRNYVIINTLSDTKNIYENVLYEAVPIFITSFPRKDDNANVYFQNVEIDNKPTSGYISSKKVQQIPHGRIEKRTGVLSDKYLQQIITQQT